MTGLYGLPNFKGVSSFIRIYEKLISSNKVSKCEIIRMLDDDTWKRIKKQAFTRSDREHNIALRIILKSL